MIHTPSLKEKLKSFGSDISVHAKIIPGDDILNPNIAIPVGYPMASFQY